MAINPTVGTRTSVTVTGLSTLANITYVAGTAVTHNTNKPVDHVYEVNVATTNTVAGNKQAKVFIQASLDGTNFTSGPTSGTTTTDEPDLIFLGVVPMNTSSTTHTAMFSIGQKLGFIPHTSKIVIFNDCGVALTSGTVFYSEISIP
jgi:hypothetical protein